MPAKIKKEELATLNALRKSKEFALYGYYISKILKEHGCDPFEYYISIEGWIVKLESTNKTVS